MNYIKWQPDHTMIAGTSLRDEHIREANNLALHTGSHYQSIIHNREQFCEELCITLAQCTFAQQTHSDHIHKVTSSDIGKGSYHYDEAIADCDALYTTEENLLIGVFHADCVPVLLYDPVKKLIAAIHSGWQGTVKAITSKTISHLIKYEHVNPSDLQAYIGPAINNDHFEVGMDVIKQIQQMQMNVTPYIMHLSHDKALLDNKGLNKAMLIQGGVRDDHIHVNHTDTFVSNPALFSYRRDHNCGRHLTFIMMQKKKSYHQ